MKVDVTSLAIPMLAAFLGVALTWLYLRSRQKLAELKDRTTSDIERAQAAEKSRSLTEDLAATRSRLAAAEAHGRMLQESVNQHIAERAQLTERAAVIPQIEEALRVARGDAQAARAEARDLDSRLSAFRAQGELSAKRVSELEKVVRELTEAREKLHDDLAQKAAELSRVTEQLSGERQASQEKLALLLRARQELSDQFKSLATEILDEKGRKFAEQNQSNLGHLLNPLKEQIATFKSKIEEVYVNEGKDRSALAEQVRQLMALNQTLHQDASNLALAIRGDRKAQGNWGEIILDDVLERAGLVEGMHYRRQSGLKAESGTSQAIPDVVVQLPGERHIVIDSKLTLPDYRVFAETQEGSERDAALRRHLHSVRHHIRGLSEKNYQSLYGLRSLDFVVMFVPLEPAFMLAVTHDGELFQHAWERNVLLVSPSTLLFVIRTVANLWRQEDQGRNAKEISARGAELYEKFVGFVKDLQEIGQRIEQAQGAYDEARKKLSEGRGNVIRQAELLKELGVKPSKTLPTELIQTAIESDRVAPGDPD